MYNVSAIPPLPPEDLHEHALAIVELLLQPLWRIHKRVHDPYFFGPPKGVRPTSRWDAPGGEFGVCYLAVGDPRIAFAETLLRGRSTLVSEADVETRSLARFSAVEPLRLVMMHGTGLRRMGATAAVSSGPHEYSRPWSLALYRHPSQPDGIIYRTRHDDDGFGVAVFDRAGDALRFESTIGLSDPGMADELGRWLDIYDAALV